MEKLKPTKLKLKELTDLQMAAAQKVLALRALSKSGTITTRSQSEILRRLSGAAKLIWRKRRDSP